MFGILKDLLGFGPRSSEAFLERGRGYLVSGRYVAAINDFTKGIEIEPDNAELHSHRASVYSTAGDAKNALLDYEKAIQCDANYAPAHQGRGLLRFANGELDESIADFDSAIRLDPEFASAYYYRAMAHREAQSNGLAEADFAEAQRLDSNLIPPVPGESAADLNLQRDVSATIAAQPQHANAPSTKPALKVVDTRVIDKAKQISGTREGTILEGWWRERWTVDSAGMQSIYDVHFEADGRGGTHFVVSEPVDETNVEPTHDVDFNEWVQNYYRDPRPEIAPMYLESLRSAGLLTDPNCYWQLLGLFAEIVAANPDRTLELLGDPTAHDIAEQRIPYAAAWLADSDCSRSYLRQAGPERLKELFGCDLLEQSPPARDSLLVLTDPSYMDYYWSRFMVTGDTRNLLKIVECLPGRGISEDQTLHVMCPIFQLDCNTGSWPDFLISFRQHDSAAALHFSDVALWSLCANARQHPEVLNFLKKTLDILRAWFFSSSSITRRMLEGIIDEVEDENAYSPTLLTKIRDPLVGWWRPSSETQKERLRREREELGMRLGSYPLRFPSEANADLRRLKRAIKIARSLSSQDPNSLEVQVTLGDFYRMAHNLDIEGAAKHCQQILTDVLRSDRDYFDAHYAIGLFYTYSVESGAALAIEHFRKAEQAAWPIANPDLYQALGFASVVQGDREAAVGYFEKFLEFLPNDCAVQELVEQLRSGSDPSVLFQSISQKT